ncbi:MAG: hypothetical protein KAS66_12745 [Candidatus Omnitrophica bacterium]|nr:hypothetical protein [Candidatus Omnitrophota bacterium]
MLYQIILAKQQIVRLIDHHYSDIYPICREQVFKAKLEEKSFPTITASLRPDDWDELADQFGMTEVDVYPDPDGIYTDKEVIWFTEGIAGAQPISSDYLNIFIYSDPYKELK